MKQLYIWSWYFVCITFLSSCQSQSVANLSTEPLISKPRFQIGDNLQWAATNYNDSHWMLQRGDTKDKVFWIRIAVTLPQPSTDHLGLAIHSFGAFECYWDGKLIGKNGIVQDSLNQEIPGIVDSYYLLPDSAVVTGTHTLALRMSQAYISDNYRRVSARITDYTSLIRSPLLQTSFMCMLAGAFLMTSLYYLFLYSQNRKRYVVLMFGVVCFLFCALLMLEYLKFYIDIPYTHFYTRLEVIGILTLIIAFLIPWYFAIQFTLPKKSVFLSVMGACLLGIYIFYYGHYDLTAQLLSFSMWIFSVGITVVSLQKHFKEALIVLVGLLASLVVHILVYYDISLFVSFVLIVLCMLYLMAVRTREQEKAYESSLLLSERLKNELLRKHIQPHFLMNTLTSLIDWVEESPKEGVVFIEALAKEFELLSVVAEHSLIPIRQEIDLCQSHLIVMKYRKEINYQWKELNIDQEEYIPPAILHTILENGITHSLPLEDGSIRFQLHFESTPQTKKYELTVFARNRPVQPGKTGTGLKYIQARLTENYGSLWSLESCAVPEGWKSTITIYHPHRAIR
ncbi:histidine kinase [Cytophagaceae bacterium DM2B3-1]|uniref:Histidine kinase n=1 Tax=Xanthocytophaga flava TaxID=3048013 RepID=A0ABT7CLD3_9BACT|nr:histidine kinase [Xanthocytophaga flavus]MDJ1468133.1 histidine kinase [Xanthocytophaga flavus]MDJ1494502.1 histidine kinase [Xanthocytophaga flavus]